MTLPAVLPGVPPVVVAEPNTAEIARQVARAEGFADAAASSAASMTPFITAPSAGNALARIVGPVEIFQSVEVDDEVVPIMLPEEVTVREIARDGLNRFRLRIQGHAGGVYTPLLREVGNGTYLDVSGYTGERYIELRTVNATAFPGVPSNTPIGRVPVDFRTGDTFGTYVSTIAYSAGGLKAERLQLSPSIRVAIVNTLNEDQRLQSSGLRLPFLDSHDEAGSWSYGSEPNFLGKFIKRVWVYTTVKNVRVGYVKNTHPRRIDFTDHDTGRTICQLYIGTDQPFPTKAKAGRGVLQLTANGWRGSFAVVELDPDASEALGGEGPYTTMAQSGIDRRCVYGPDEVRALMRAEGFKHVLKCGTGEEFATVAAVNADSRCQLAHPNELVKVEFAAETFTGSNFIRPEYCGWFGKGPGQTIFDGPTGVSTPTIQSYLDGWEVGFTAHAASNQYALHCETNSYLWGAEYQERAVFKYRQMVELSAGAGHDQNLLGGGIGGMCEVEQDTILRKRVSATNKADFSWHNTAALPSGPPNNYDPNYTRQAFPAKVTLRNCPEAQGTKTTGADLSLISLIPDSDPGAAPMSHAVLYDNDFATVKRTLTNASAHQWEAYGAGVTVT